MLRTRLSKEPIDMADIVVSNLHYGDDHASNISDLLFSAARAIQIRSEVSSILESIVDDIDVTHQLQVQVDYHQELVDLEKMTQSTLIELEEYRLIFQKSARQRLQLADSFTQQLWALDAELNVLQQKNTEYEMKAKIYDQMIELWNSRIETKDENNCIIDIFRSIMLGQKHSKDDQAVPSSDGQLIVTSVSTDAINELSTETNQDQKEQESLEYVGSETFLKQTIETYKQSIQNNSTNRKDTDAAPHSYYCRLDHLSDKLLMDIFNFLTAEDILNFAQTSMRYYSKVDRLFGLGEDENSVNRNSPSSQNEDMDRTNDPLITSPSSSKDSASMNHQNPLDMKEVKSLHESLDPTKPSNTKQSVQNYSMDAHINDQIQGPKGLRAMGSLSQVLTLLPSVDKGSFGGLMKSKIHGKKTNGHLTLPNYDPSLVSKLTPTELSAIISLRDERQKCMLEIQRLVAENNNLHMAVDGFEPMKNNLLATISKLEASLQQKNEELKHLNDELSSDQEVIAFLDERVHDLERKCQALEEEKNRAVSSVDAVKSATQKQLIVMGDMLKFERENLSENEKGWKATKKLLVKEIKNCRALNLTLQAERDACSEQCNKYREALLQPGGISSFVKER